LSRIDAEHAPIRAAIPRFVEAALAAAGIVVASPVLAIVAIAVRLSSPGPILFRQNRVGQDGVEFVLLKFRTMRMNQSGPMVTARGDQRVTPVGRWLRFLKLDELPELWNVVRGDMSLVGPRPEVPKYVDLTKPAWREVLQVRPGITDSVTLLLRNEEDLMASVPGDPERFYLDVLQPYKLNLYRSYLRRRSFLSDLGIIFKTLFAVVAPTTAPPPSLLEIQQGSREGAIR
jgi:lipopolysaccharide/colanic/teichoic acid biosynthesis glycosyltransferase